MLVKDIYHPHPRTIKENLTVKEALSLLIKDEYNSFIVIDKNEKVVGVLSLQDIAGATVPDEFKDNIHMASAMYRIGYFRERCQEIKDKKVKEIMRRNFVWVDLKTNVMTITADFLKNDLYIVPVIEKNKLIGIITRSEIKKALAEAMSIK